MNKSHTLSQGQLLTLESVYGIYCDAWVDDEEMLVFASFWGPGYRYTGIIGKADLVESGRGA